jgi:signal transduction histidine kinase
MMHERKHAGVAWAVACCVGLAAIAAAKEGEREIVPIADIRFFPASAPEVGRRRDDDGPRRAVVRGVVVWISKSRDEGLFLAIQDASAGIWVTRGFAEERGIWRGADAVWDQLEPGMTIEVEGLQDLDGGYAPLLVPSDVRIVSRDCSLPEAERVDIDRFFSGADAGKRIEAEGIVQGYRDAGSRWILVLSAAGRRFIATVPRQALPADPDALVDGRLLLRGAAASRFTTRGEFIEPVIRVYSAEDVVLVAPSPSGPFEAPRLPLHRLAGFRGEPPSGHRVRTSGVVTYAEPGEFFFIQEGAVGVRVETQSTESLEPGDMVEVAGFIDRSRVVAGVAQAARVTEGVFRRLGSGVPPRPLAIAPDDILAVNGQARRNGLLAKPGDYHGTLIAFKARLVESRRSVTGGSLLLSSGKSMLAATVLPATFQQLSRLEPGSELEVVGIVQADLKPQVGTRPIWHLPAVERLELIVRSPDDVRLVRPPSWWTPRRLAVALLLTGGLLALALSWVWLLRRRVRATARNLADEMRTRREAAIEFDATIRERNRLAANLHDTLLQTMSAIGMQLQSCELSARQGSGPSGNHLGLARRMVDHAIGELRESVWALRSFPLKGQTLPAAIESVAAQLGEGHAVHIAVCSTGAIGPVPDFVAGNLLLVVQEAIHNALQHAAPTTIDVLVTHDAAADAIEITIRDDGRGFVPGTQVGPREGHFGLQGMRERVERLGGILTLESEAGAGTTIRARVGDLSTEFAAQESPGGVGRAEVAEETRR